MEYCAECEAFDNCHEKLYCTTSEEFANGIRVYMPGLNCPKKREEFEFETMVKARRFRGTLVTADSLLDVDECVEKFRGILQRAFDGKRCRMLDVHFSAKVDEIPTFNYSLEEYIYKAGAKEE